MGHRWVGITQHWLSLSPLSLGLGVRLGRDRAHDRVHDRARGSGKGVRELENNIIHPTSHVPPSVTITCPQVHRGVQLQHERGQACSAADAGTRIWSHEGWTRGARAYDEGAGAKGGTHDETRTL